MAKFNLKKLATNLVRNDILVPYIDLYQARGDFPDVWNIEIRNTKESDSYFHPSGDCFTDPVELYREATSQIKRNAPNFALRRVFDCGHMWHGYYQNILVAMEMVEQQNVELVWTHVTAEYRWTGRGTLDLFDVMIPGHPNHIVDIKTMNDVEFDEGPRTDTFKKWEAQVNCYMDWTDCHDAIILAIRKGGTKNKSGRPQHDLKEFRIEYKPELLKEIYGRWEQAQRYIDGTDKVPTLS